MVEPWRRRYQLAGSLADVARDPTALLPNLLTSLGASAAALGVIEGLSDGLAGGTTCRPCGTSSAAGGDPEVQVPFYGATPG